MSIKRITDKVIFLMGPTASGKTELTLRLKSKFPLEIISVDSSQVYRGFDIGAAKPSKEMLDKHPHRLINLRNPSESYNVSEFIDDAKCAISEIISKGRVPILVGGSMLYFKSLLSGINDLPKADLDFRQIIEEKAEKYGWPTLHNHLKKIDPLTAEKLHPNHSNRIQRALEVYYKSGVPLSVLQTEFNKSGISENYSVLQLGLLVNDRSVLYRRIEERFFTMIDHGLLDEVKELFARGELDLNTPASRSVGYRQLRDWCSGDLDLDDAIGRGIQATRNLAKRQLTWLRKWPNLQTCDIDNAGKLLTCLELENKVSKLVSDHLLL